MCQPFRTDINNNPTAFTTDIAKEGGLLIDKDYTVGTAFKVPNTNPNLVASIYYTAKLLGNPLDLTIKIIDNIGFFTKTGNLRWVYIGIPFKLWQNLTLIQKQWVIGYMYNQEGGVAMQDLFPQELI